MKNIERKYESLIRAIGSITYEYDIITNYVEWHGPFEKLLGYKREDLEWNIQGWLNKIHPDDLEESKKKLHNAINIIWNFSHEYRFRHKNGHYLWFHDRGCVYGSRNESMMIGLMEDITERKNHEAKMKKQTDQLIEKNKVLEEFTYSVSHDLQEPLRKIKSFGKLLKDSLESKLDADQKRWIGYMVDGSNNMQTLVQDLLELSSLDTIEEKPKLNDLNLIVENSMRHLSEIIKQTKSQITVKKMPTVRGRESQFVQLFMNLIGNAIKYQKQGNIPKIIIEYAEHKGQNRFLVKDNGIGFDPKYKEQVFGVFNRLYTKGRYAGNGVGLAICKRIVEKHEGNISVDTEPNKGSIFWFTLGDFNE